MRPEISNLHQSANWSGIWTALITPLRPKAKGIELDVDSLAHLIQSQIHAGITGLVIAGSTGEGSLLNSEMYEQLLIEAKKAADGKIPLVAGLGIGGTEACLKNLEIAKRWNYAAVLASPPAYVKAPQRGLAAHFLRLAAEGLPVCLYEIAGRAASAIEVSTLRELANSSAAHAAKFVALKDASANLQRALDVSAALTSAKNPIAMLSGDDGTFAAYLSAGGCGVISVVSHILPRSLRKILDLAKAGNAEGARAEQCRINPLIEAMFWESNPVPIKSLLAKIGVIKSNQFCEPLLPMESAKLEKLFSLAEKIKDAT